MRKAVFIAGGGTGGHIYPAMAIAHSLRTMAPDLQIHFVGSRGGLESKIIPEHGFPLHLVPIGKLNHNVSLAERLKTLVSLPISFLVSLFFYSNIGLSLLLELGGSFLPRFYLRELCFVFALSFGSQMLFQEWPIDCW